MLGKLFLATALISTGPGLTCAMPGQPQPRPPVATPAVAAPQVSYTVPGTVPVLAQPTAMSCWAASAAMLVSWKESKTVSPDDFAKRLSERFRILYDTDAGLGGDDKADLLKEAGLRDEAPQNYTVDGWQQLLKTYGPLWVTTAIKVGKRWGVHARVVTAINGDGTVSGTKLHLLDPDGGVESDVSVADFAKLMEKLATMDLGNGAEIRPMVVHF